MMNKQEINIAIAEVCGWTQIHNANTIMVGGYWIGYPPTTPIIGEFEEIPNYYEDLNAIQMAIFSIPFGDSEEVHFFMALEKIVGEGDLYGCVVATAVQRCEAFLKTLGKWKE